MSKKLICPGWETCQKGCYHRLPHQKHENCQNRCDSKNQVCRLITGVDEFLLRLDNV